MVTLQASFRPGWTTSCQKWKVLLIFQDTYRLSGTGFVECLEIIEVRCNLMAWPDWVWPPTTFYDRFQDTQQSRFLTAGRCLENLVLHSISDMKSFILDDVKLAVIQQQLRMKRSDIFRGGGRNIHIHIFRGQHPSNLHDLCPWLPQHLYRSDAHPGIEAGRRIIEVQTSSKSSEQSMPAALISSDTPPGWKSMYGVMLYTLPGTQHVVITITIKNLYSACSQKVSRALRRRLNINIEQKKYVLR